jgi:hypothetical protein
MIENNPFDIENIMEKQDVDVEIQRMLRKYPQWFSRKTINVTDNVLCYTKPGDDPANWKIMLPNDLIRPTVEW